QRTPVVLLARPIAPADPLPARDRGPGRPTAAAGLSRRDATVLSRRSGAVPSRTRRPWSAYAIESQRLDRVLLQDQVVYLRFEVGRLEVLEPAIRRDEREVRAKQHLVLELAVRVAHELIRKVLWRPT